AAAALARALAGYPANGTLKRMLALALFSSEAYDQAVNLLQKDAGRDMDASLLYIYGVALVRSGHAAEAESTFTRLLRLHGDSPELLVVLGQARVEEGDYDGAAASLRRALELK